MESRTIVNTEVLSAFELSTRHAQRKRGRLDGLDATRDQDCQEADHDLGDILGEQDAMRRLEGSLPRCLG